MELAALGATIASAASAAAPYALVASTGLTAASQIMQAREQSKAAAFESEQLQIQSDQYKTAAAQDEANRRRELESNLETIQAIRSGRGVGLSSPGGRATLDAVTTNEERDIGIAKSNYLTRSDLSRRASEMASDKASTSLLAGYLGAAGTAASAVFKYGTMGSYAPRPAGR